MTFRDVSAFNVSGKVSELQVSFLNVSNDVESLKRLGYLSRVTSNRFIYDSDIGRMLYNKDFGVRCEQRFRSVIAEVLKDQPADAKRLALVALSALI